MKTGNTGRERSARGDGFLASMEPGHEDREYVAAAHFLIGFFAPQWSPVMKTGNTAWRHRSSESKRKASMEPGHEDREYRTC